MTGFISYRIGAQRQYIVFPRHLEIYRAAKRLIANVKRLSRLFPLLLHQELVRHEGDEFAIGGLIVLAVDIVAEESVQILDLIAPHSVHVFGIVHVASAHVWVCALQAKNAKQPKQQSMIETILFILYSLLKCITNLSN